MVMRTFKKVFKFQLKALPVLALAIFMVGALLHETRKAQFREISKDEFIALALRDSITAFAETARGYEMTTRAGDRVFHDFHAYSEHQELQEKVLRQFNSFGTSNMPSFYAMGISWVFGSMLAVFVLNILVLWFVVLFNLLQHEFTERHNKWIWLVCLMAFPLIAPAYYIFIAENQQVK